MTGEIKMIRRDFIKAFGSLSTAYIMGNDAVSAYAGGGGKLSTNKSIIFIFLGGGISAADSFVIKPNVLPEYAPINGYIQSKAGYLLGSDFPNLSTISDKMVSVRNYKTYDGNHSTATAYSLTGKPSFGLAEGSPAKEPSAASFMSYVFGTNNDKNGLPTYVKLNRNMHDGSAWLGSKYMGFEATDDGIKTLQINSSPETFKRRNQMVNEIEAGNGRDDHYFKEWSNLRNQARDIVMGDAAQAFNISNEDKAWLTKYDADKGGFGKNCLLARRLIQAGSKVVTLEHGGWDMHNDISAGFKARSVDLDKYLTVLVNDLKSKGMFEDTMIVVTSEFSRTKVNMNKGRDHNPNICSLLFLNDGLTGSTIGDCDSYALVAEGNPYGPKDLFWTMFNWLGVPKDYTLIDNMKRPRHLFTEDDRIIV